MTENDRSFSGKAVRRYRETLNVSQVLLSRKLGVSDASVGVWETGYAVPRVDKLPRLADALGCKIDDLFE